MRVIGLAGKRLEIMLSNTKLKFNFYFSTVDIKAELNKPLTLELQDQIFSSPYCQPYNSHNVGLENLVLDQQIIPKLIFFFSHHLSG